MSTDPETTPPSSDQANWAMFAHLSALAALVCPFGNIIGPLVIMLTKGKENQFIHTEAVESLNFQITMTLAMIVAAATMVVLIGFILLPAVALVDLVLVVLAAVAASKGEAYRYPFALRLVS